MSIKQTFSLEDVALPDVDANKPAEIELPEKKVDTAIIDDKGDDGVAADDATKSDDAQPDDKKPEDTPDDTPTDDKPSDDKKPEDTQPAPTVDKEVDKEPKTELTPFHEHPDWKKMQEKVDRLEREKQELERKNADPYPTQTPLQRAEARVRAEKAEGKFKDDFEAMNAYNTYIQEEQKKDQDRVAADVNAAFSEISQREGSLTQDQQEKIVKQVQEWKAEGLGVTPQTVKQTLKIAYAHLKKTGAFETKPTTTPQPAADPKDTNKDAQPQGGDGGTSQPDKEKKESANSRIAKPKGGGNPKPTTQSKVIIPNAARMNLGQLTEALSEQLE